MDGASVEGSGETSVRRLRNSHTISIFLRGRESVQEHGAQKALENDNSTPDMHGSTRWMKPAHEREWSQQG